MHKGVILGVQPEHTLPDPLIEKLVKEFDSFFGFAVCDNDSEPAGLSYQGVPQKMTADGFRGFLEMAKDRMVVVYCGKHDGEWTMDSYQPYVLLRDPERTDNQNGSLLVFLEGDFSDYAPPDGKNAAEHYVVEQTITPKIATLVAKYEGDLEKIWEGLNDDVLTRDLKNTCKNRCSIVFFCEHGIHRIDKGKEFRDFDWGYMSHHHGYGEANYPPEDGTKKKGSFLDAVRSVLPGMTSLPGAEKKGPAIPGSATAIKTVPTVAAAIPASAGMDKNFIYPPSTVRDKNSYKQWVHNVLLNKADFPKDKNWAANRPPIHISLVKPDKLTPEQLELVKGMAPVVEEKKEAPAAPTPKKVAIPGSTKDTSIKNFKEGSSLPAEAGKKETIKRRSPILNPDAKDRLMKSGVLGHNAQVTMSPDQMYEIEQRFPTFTENYGLNGLEDTFGWDFQAWVELGAVDMESLALALCQYQVSYLKALQEEKATVVKPETTPASTVHAQATATKKVAIPQMRKAG